AEAVDGGRLPGGRREAPDGAGEVMPYVRRKRSRSLLRSPLCVEGILAWADAWHARTGRWPSRESGPIPESAGNTWMAVNVALGKGHRATDGAVADRGQRPRGRRAGGDGAGGRTPPCGPAAAGCRAAPPWPGRCRSTAASPVVEGDTNATAPSRRGSQ